MRRQKKSVSTPLLSCLILTSVFGCAGFPERPNGHVYHVDTINGVAYEMSVPRKVNQDFKYTGKDIPLESLDKFFCVSPMYQMQLQFWIDDVVSYAEEKCK